MLSVPKAEREPPCEPAPTPQQMVLTLDNPDDDFIQKFPRWLWVLNPEWPTWTPQFQVPDNLVPPAQLSVENAKTIARFLRQVSWVIKEECATSFLELAYLMRYQDFKLESPNQTPSCYLTQIKKAVNFFGRRHPDIQLCPGVLSNKILNNGRTHPPGFFKGAAAILPIAIRKRLAVDFQRGRNQYLPGWNFDF